MIHGQKSVRVSQNEWFYLSSLRAADARLAPAIREHWKIENQAHWVFGCLGGSFLVKIDAAHAAIRRPIIWRYSDALLSTYCVKTKAKTRSKPPEKP